MAVTSHPVLVTGASGFLATHTIIQLLEQGYKVRGTLRTMSRENEVRETLRKYVNADDRLEFVNADLGKEEGWEQAVQGCEYVLHVASPFPLYEPEHEDELIKPAVEGTLCVLRAAHAAKVKRVVQVSSNAAISTGHEGENRAFTEEDWSRLDRPIGAYAKSKTLAERAAWDFINGTENVNKMELATINPPLIVGPIPNKNFPTSAEAISTLLRGQVPGIARLKMGVVDVRDVASAIILAMSTPEAAGQRFLCSGGTAWIKDIAEILHAQYGSRGYKIPRLVFPVFLAKLVALFDKKVALVIPSLNWDFELSSDKAKRVLNWQPRSSKEAILSMAESLIENGLV
ncbi:MAG: aldehyde reductase [Anaerolineales bacterium]|nr:aldehyde reductase [Anaerolineales bacterium]